MPRLPLPPPVAWPLLLLAVAAPVSMAAGSTLTGTVLVAGLILGIRDGRWRHPGPVAVCLLAFAAIGALATLATPYDTRWDKFVDETWIKFLVLAIPALRLPAPWIQRVVQLFLAVSSLVAIYAIVQHFTGVDLWRGGTTNAEGDRFLSGGFFGHHLTYGGHVLVAWCAAVAASIDAARRRALPALGAGIVMVALLSLALLWSQARSAQIGALVAGLVFVLTAPGSIRPWLLGGGALGIVAAALTPTLAARFTELANLENEATRLNLWKSAWAGIQDRPWLGWGPGNFSTMQGIHEVEGFYDSRAHTHQDYLMHAVNAGIPGLLAALAFLMAQARGLARQARESWVPNAALAALVGLAAAGFFQVFQSDDEVEISLYLLVGCGLAIARANARSESTDRASEAP